MLDDAEGDSVGSMIVDLVLEMLHEEHEIISGIGISIPGISRKRQEVYGLPISMTGKIIPCSPKSNRLYLASR